MRSMEQIALCIVALTAMVLSTGIVIAGSNDISAGSIDNNKLGYGSSDDIEVVYWEQLLDGEPNSIFNIKFDSIPSSGQIKFTLDGNTYPVPFDAQKEKKIAVSGTLSVGNHSVSVSGNNFDASCSLTVGYAPTSIALLESDVTIEEESTKTLAYTVYPRKAVYSNVEWRSSDNSVATVNNGTVTAISEGNASIYMVVKNPKTGTEITSSICHVTVTTVKETYTITYHYNGGTEDRTAVKKFTDVPFKINVNTEKTGYTHYWSTANSPDPTKKITDIEEKKNYEIYAIWTPVKYTITYDVKGGTLSGEVTSYTIETNTFNLVEPTKEGYNFLGWYDSKDTKYTQITKGTTGNKEFFAKWSDESYRITYNLNGGENHADNPSTYEKGKEVILKDPSKTGYIFDGWYNNATFSGSKITKISTTTTGNITLYAKWIVIIYDIEYELDGGTNDPANPKEYTVTSEITLKDPSKTGYKFDGWYDNGIFSGSKITKIEKNTIGDKTLYAKWNTIEYKITYNLNAGTNHTSNPAKYTVETSTITLQDPTKTGNEFAGWYDNSGLTGTPVTKILKGSTGDRTLYAKWNVQYTITVTSNNPNMGTATSSLSKAIAGQEITLTAVPKTGYVLKKYICADVDIGSNSKFNMPSKNITVTAEFEDASKVYTVSFSSSNTSIGTVDKSQVKVTTGTTFTTSKNVLTFSDGQKITATVKTSSQTDKINLMTGWSASSGTISANASIKAIFETKNIYDTRTISSSNGFKVSGDWIRYDAVLTVEKKDYKTSDWTEVDPEYSKSTYDKLVYNIELKSATSAKVRDPDTGNLTLMIPMDTKYNGQTITVFHRENSSVKNLGTILVTGGYASVETKSFSPFLIVTEKVSKVTSVTLDIKELELKPGSEKQLTATVLPTDAKTTSVIWMSSNGEVATVDANGKVTAKAEGTTTITVKTDDGGLTDTCEITVKNSSILFYMLAIMIIIIAAIVIVFIRRNRNVYDFERRTHF